MCVGRCKRLFYCLCGGGGTRAPSSSSPLRTIGPAQSAEGVWPKRGSEAKGRSFVGFAERGVLVCRRSERKRNERERVLCVKNSRVFEASEQERKGVLSLENSRVFERGVLVCRRSERKRNEREKEFSVWTSVGLEACSGFEARRKGKGDSAEKETERTEVILP